MFKDENPSPPSRDRSHHPRINLREGAEIANAAAEVRNLSWKHWPTPKENVVPNSILKIIRKILE